MEGPLPHSGVGQHRQQTLACHQCGPLLMLW